MDEFLLKGLLYSIYGALLTNQQRTIYEYHVIEDLSFTEIGEELHISRQAAQDLFKRADDKLKKYDEKLALSKKFIEIEKLSNLIQEETTNKKIKDLSKKIIDLI